MKTNIKIILGVVLIAVVGLLFYFVAKKAPVTPNLPIVTTEDNILGCYVAKLAKDVYVLKVESNTNGLVSGMIAFNNYEKDSSSGSFTGTYSDGILLGNYSFDSEGMHSEMQVIFKKVGNNFVQGYGPVKSVSDKIMFEDISNIIYDSNATFVKSDDCMEQFTEVNNKFTFDYNPFFKVYQGQDGLSTDWKLNAKEKGVLLAKVSIPRSYISNTNFSGAYLTVGASTDPKQIKSCGTDALNGEVKIGQKMIEGHSFTKFSLGDAGAGNFYETTSYRGLLDGDCYAIEYTIHSTNIGVYSPDQGIKEFDKTKIQNELENIVSSFKFLVNSN